MIKVLVSVVLQGCTGSYRVLKGFAKFCKVQMWGGMSAADNLFHFAFFDKG